MDERIIIRTAQNSDTEELLEIYRFYVENTAISFECAVPSAEEFRDRIQRTLSFYPWLVALRQDEIVGYACASRFKEREAYDWCAESTIYLKEKERGNGYGRQLYSALENCLQRQGVLNLNACIAVTDHPDTYLTNASRDFHSHLGYRLVGRFYRCGYKFGCWYDMIWMEKMLGDHENFPCPVIPFLPEMLG